MDLPEFISPPPEKEAMELALDALIFDPVAADAKAREGAGDTETPPLNAYLLLDASISPDIPICVEAFPEQARCLFDGAAFEDLAEVGPWLVELRRYGSAWDWYVADGYGHNWGIIVHTRLPLMKLKTQLKKFIKIQDEEGQTYFFKFYRPQHLNAYLPSFDDDQRSRFLRGVDAMWAETHGAPEQLLSYALDGSGQLTTQAHNLVETGMPMRIQPPTPEEADAILKRAAEGPKG